VLVGGPGSGKTHLATAIGLSGIVHHGKRVRFYSTVDLANALEQEGAKGPRRTDCGEPLAPSPVPFSRAGGALLFHLPSRLYEHTSVATG
jgi:IstB-like ATP binding protein